ncbi:MAG: hypothetical protein AAGI51_11200 [Pseudomonadota bacterium]
MTDNDRTLYVGDIPATQIEALERHARQLRSQAIREAFLRLFAWFAKARTEGKAPADGRTA